jgi:hypothetical protein
MRGTGIVACMVRRKDSIKNYIKLGYEGVEWNQLVQGTH